ncbi:WD40 repeat-like protein [Pluteus cervinus]|uniref:WD40 repeat-like protein n=1 Tax=Pluteus cervinus TaxID=181527 RepID=A0ACD3A221_9AGAR|nr:WD40 repeat-like protein [Pluteus cervinus]
MASQQQQPRRRVSYVIPAPTEPLPELVLPPCGSSRLGATGPNIIPLTRSGSTSPLSNSSVARRNGGTPKHRLGVASLAIDSTTLLHANTSPEGILYSGGRDGMVMSWDLGLPFVKKRNVENDGNPLNLNLNLKGGTGKRRWEVMVGWLDEDADEDDEDGDERIGRDGDVLGEVTTPLQRAKQYCKDAGVVERQWQFDSTSLQPHTPSHFRQCCQMHMDWINDIILCNYNQTVVTASSDGTIKAWNPHTSVPSEPTLVGTHNDYVRCLTQCPDQNWIASGSFDRTIKLWDLNKTGTDPITTLNPPDANAPKSSIYAIACDRFGTTIASGSPERVVRMWDPRSGKRTGKLVGHTDNIRAILMSDDSRYLLTGSADATIKLWSLASQRCLHTFTYHADSVWSLYSSHPSLEVFYSGDRSGIVCKVDVEGCTDIGEGECVVLAQDSADQGKATSEGINKIIALDDDELVWTASGSSSIKRWKAPPRRALRVVPIQPEVEERPRSESPLWRPRLNSSGGLETNARPPTGQGHRASMAPSLRSIASLNRMLQHPNEAEMTLFGIEFDSLVHLPSPIDAFSLFPSTSGRADRDPEVATLYSAASVMSVPRNSMLRSPTQTVFPRSSPLRGGRTEDMILPPNSARAAFGERELAAEAIPLQDSPDYVITGDHGLVRSIILNDRLHALTVDTSGVVGVWDLIRGRCLGAYSREVVAVAAAGGSSSEVGSGGSERELGPREMLEIVRERVEGEAMVSQWCVADTKTGVLTIHVNDRCFEAEVYADEVGFMNDKRFNDESKMNLGKWILRNLFKEFIREQQRLRHTSEHGDRSSVKPPSPVNRTAEALHRLHRKTSSLVVCSPTMSPIVTPNYPRTTPPTPLLLPTTIPIIPPTAEPGDEPTPTSSQIQTLPPYQRKRSGTLDGLTGISPPPSAMKEDYFITTPRNRKPSLPGIIPPSANLNSNTTTPANTSAGTNTDDFSGWSGPAKGSLTPAGQDVPPTPSTPSGLMGRLKSFGGKMAGRRPLSDVTTSPAVNTTSTPETPAVEASGAAAGVNLSAVQTLLAGTLSPPTTSESPNSDLPPSTTILIAEEGLPGYSTVYRGSVASTHLDLKALEEAMPMWLLEYLLLNKIPQSAPLPKLSFVLMPWPEKEEKERLPELLNTTQSKLTAGRYLRVRKLVLHVHERLEKMASASSRPTTAASNGTNTHHSIHSHDVRSSDPRPSSGSVGGNTNGNEESARNAALSEELYEVLCNDVILPLDMTLAAVRQYVWRQGGELVMYYRRRRKS